MLEMFYLAASGRSPINGTLWSDYRSVMLETSSITYRSITRWHITKL